MITPASKYGNVPAEVDGITFHSKREARRYEELRLLERGGAIADLMLQPRFPLRVNDIVVGTYVGDFTYTDTETGQRVVEDVKGHRTREYQLKRKLMKAIWDIDILET